MAVQIIKTTFQFKRGSAETWLNLNPILAQGEPGFEYNTGKLKIGNGIDSWVDLPYVNESSVINAPSIVGFPPEGEPDVIYKAENEKQLYQWNEELYDYELLINPSSYVTKEELQAAIDKIEIPELALEEYATKEYVQELFVKIVPLTKEEILDACE
jgi:hypothetical protein